MSAALAVETRDLVRRFRGHAALDHLDLALPTGGVHALVGRNGAGKSTLFRLLLGFLAPSSGTARVLGFDSLDLPASVRGRIGCVLESHPLPGWMRVAELAGMQRRLHPEWSEATFREVASLFRLPAESRVRQLSRGERAGLSLALAVAPGPELLLLDEPTAGLDVVANHAFLEALLFAGGRELGTILFSSHQMADVERVAESLIVLDRGKVVAQAAPDDLRARVGAWRVEEWPAGRPWGEVPGLLQVRALEREHQLFVLDEDERFAARLAELGARGVTRQALGFERAMDAFLQGSAGAAGEREGQP